MLHREELFASAPPGLEAALFSEARELGFEARLEDGGVAIAGPLGTYRRANLHLRIANRVLLRVARLPRRGLGPGLAALSLAAFRPPGTPVTVRASGHGARELEATALRALGEGPRAASALEVQLRSRGDEVLVSVDTSGELLHFRGYRQELSMAPLRETLAAGILRVAGWSGERPLCDPLCGSGTMAIEAAWVALRRAPGLQRTFAFERWPSHDRVAWEREQAAAREAERSQVLVPLLASDIHAGALGTARRNARRAGVVDWISLERKDVAQLALPEGLTEGLVVSNLPYGRRVGAPDQLAGLYRSIGLTLRQRFSGWQYALLVEAPDAERALGLAPSRVIPIQNGGLPCRLLLGSASGV